MDFLRSCYRGTWNLPAADHVRGYYYFCDPGTPHYPDWHYFGSRNWHQGDGTPWPALGEVEDIAQQWRDGSFPTTKPDARRIGTQACIEGTGEDDIQPGPLIAGVDARCWLVRPPWGGLAGGGEGTARVETGGGLAGGGASKFVPSPSGGIAGGGSSHAQAVRGGLWAGPDRGGLEGGGSSESAAIAGGLLGGGLSSARISGPIALIQSAVNSGSAITTVSVNVSWPASTTAGNHLVAVLSWGMGGSTQQPTITTPAGWTLAIRQNRSGGGVAIYFKENAAAQSTTGNWTAAGQATFTQYLTVAVEENSNLLLTGSLDKTNGATGVGTHPATGSTGTLSQAKELCIGAIHDTNGATFSAPTNGYTIRRQQATAGESGALLDLVVSSSSSTSTGCSPNATWAAAIATFRGN